MHPGLTTRTAALLAAALAVASALGYWGVSTYRKSELQKAVTALVKDTSERLQAALAIETGTMSADQTVGRLDDHAQEVDKHVLELRDDMRAAKRRSGSWIQEALRAKDRLEKDYSDYRLSAEALSRLLESYPDARKKLALHVGGALLADEGTAATARKRALENSKRVASEVEKARQLAAVR